MSASGTEAAVAAKSPRINWAGGVARGEVEALQGPATEFGEEKAGADVVTLALVAAQIALRHVGIEVVGGSAVAGTAGHDETLDGAEERAACPAPTKRRREPTRRQARN
jgi:hypothetical protein